MIYIYLQNTSQNTLQLNTVTHEYSCSTWEVNPEFEAVWATKTPVSRQTHPHKPYPTTFSLLAFAVTGLFIVHSKKSKLRAKANFQKLQSYMAEYSDVAL